MFKKISTISNMGVFKNFHWDSEVRDKGGNIVAFKEVNILYGRNYSGKTTLARIFRAIEKKELPPKHETFEFSVQDYEGRVISQNTLNQNDKTIRVFNTDFVKENLRFIIDDERDISSFAVLGAENARIEEQIENLELELGSEGENTGLYAKLKFVEEQMRASNAEHTEAKDTLEEDLINKARDIKENDSHLGGVNYDVRKIKKDIDETKQSSYSAINSDKGHELQSLLKDEPKPEILPPPNLNLEFEKLSEKTKNLIEWEINISEPIQALVNDSLLHEWVREGRDLHKNKRTSCGFCGNELPGNLWDKLDKHFNKESEQLRQDIEKLIGEIEVEDMRVQNLADRNSQDFYSDFHNEINKINSDFREKSNAYLKMLVSLKSQLEKRKNNTIQKLTFQMPESIISELLDVHGRLQKVIDDNNKYSDELASKQEAAKNILRLAEVYGFIVVINYNAKNEKIAQLKNKAIEAKRAFEKKENLVSQKNKNISKLKSQLGDESKGAERINSLITGCFGHQFLSLDAIKDESDSLPKYRFEIKRGEKKAYNLSEGECSLIAFCYFIAKLGDIETKGKKPIIWIDDPVSSLDSNHVFFIFGLIDSRIVKPKDYEQLFISTHSLDFLKYLKRISKDYKGKGKSKEKIREFFLVERENGNSDISVMPRYMKEYVTEFNYLFHQIHKCANASTTDDKNYQVFYNFGNNARKFLEIFLYYRYPDMRDTNQKLIQFFGDDQIPQIVINRIDNEYSHLSGELERGAQPIEAPIVEMQKEASFILEKIKNHDKEQYNAFLKSIGENCIEDEQR